MPTDRSTIDYNLVSIISKYAKDSFCAPGLEVIKLSSCSTQLSIKFILLINVTKPTIGHVVAF